MNKKLSNQITKYKIKIRKLILNTNNFIIESYDGEIFEVPIKKGSIQCKIYNEANQEVNLSSIEENSLVTIIKNKNTEKNSIVIRKIIVKNNYVFNSDSSTEYNEFN
jgi:hypothetical protein